MEPVVLGVGLTAGLATIAWFFRQWSSELGTKVDDLSDKVDTLDEKVDTLTSDVAQMKVVIGWPPILHYPR